VRRLRERGALRGVITSERTDVDRLAAELADFPTMEGRALVDEVTRAGRTEIAVPDGVSERCHLAVYDFGIKTNILRELSLRGARLTVLPARTPADEVLKLGADGVVLSNGPGDPEPLRDEIATVTDILGRVPLLGICLGHQLVALATGHETYKLPFGHRGANHPVLEKRTGRVLVTSQNHGFAVRETDERTATHVSLYDGTVEGFDYPELRARSLQFHPEAGPGPHDAYPLIESWVEELRAAA
jgi:carbamoyl-phosphate synthase small subunit